MNANILFDIYKTTRDNGAADLVIGLAMYKAEHPGVISDVEDRDIREEHTRPPGIPAAVFIAKEEAKWRTLELPVWPPLP